MSPVFTILSLGINIPPFPLNTFCNSLPPFMNMIGTQVNNTYVTMSGTSATDLYLLVHTRHFLSQGVVLWNGTGFGAPENNNIRKFYHFNYIVYFVFIKLWGGVGHKDWPLFMEDFNKELRPCYVIQSCQTWFIPIEIKCNHGLQRFLRTDS